MTTLLPPNVKVHLGLGYIDMRKGIDGLAMLVQGVLRQDPFSGHLFVFRGRTRANLIKVHQTSKAHLFHFSPLREHRLALNLDQKLRMQGPSAFQGARLFASPSPRNRYRSGCLAHL